MTRGEFRVASADRLPNAIVDKSLNCPNLVVCRDQLVGWRVAQRVATSVRLTNAGRRPTLLCFIGIVVVVKSCEPFCEKIGFGL